MSDYYSPMALQARAVLERKKRAESGIRVLSQYELFKQKYFNDPAGFVRDCIEFRNGNQMAPYQDKALSLLPDRRRVSVRGPHGLGKSALMSFAILWFALTRDGLDWKVPITASVWRQLSKYLLPELHKWARRLRWDIIGRPAFSERELLVENLKLTTGEAFALASAHPEYIEGAHGDHMLYIFDESKSIVDSMWDSAEGAFSTGNCVVGSTIATGPGVECVSRREYKGIVIDIKTAGGNILTVTPNHPILTPDGWVFAGSLNIGDKVIACADRNTLMSSVEPYSENVPSRIDDTFKSYGVLNRPVARRSTMLGAENFDCSITDRKVDVIPSDRLLNNRSKPGFDKNLVNVGLKNAPDESAFLSGYSGFNKTGIRFSNPSTSVSPSRRSNSGLNGVLSNIGSLRLQNVSSFDIEGRKIFSNNGPGYAVSFGEIANRISRGIREDKGVDIRRSPLRGSFDYPSNIYASADEPTSNSMPTDSDLAGNLNRAFPGNVFVDDIVDLTKRDFTGGHVYNLQTETHWFIANDESSNSVGGIITHNCYWLACSTPGEPKGRFYDIHSRAPGFDDWAVLHVTKDEAIAAGRMSGEWAESRRRQWGETSPVYQNRVEGNFADSATDGVIPLAWIEAANERYLAWQELGFPGTFTGIGSDVGGDGPGNDRSTIATAFDYVKIREIRVGGVGDPHLSTMNLVGQIGGIVDAATRSLSVNRGELPIIVDVIGIGAGVTHRLRELGFNAFAYNAGKSTTLRDKTDELGFFNWRAAGWWILREMLEPESGFDVCLPPDTDETNLTGDLIAPTYTITSDSLIQVESKDLIRRRIKRSTDYADAVIQAIVGPILIEADSMEKESKIVLHYNPPDIRG